jgi:SAM-dependent methyltransferase
VHWGTAEHLLSDGQLGTFDVVVSWDVLEHVSDPAEFIRLAALHVAPGGYFIFSTLDRTNWFARIMGKRWPWLIPMHLHYFDQESVVSMTERHGFAFVSTRAHVHYTSAAYAWRRLVGHGNHVESSDHAGALDRIIFPVGFGDVRLYVFRNLRRSTSA